MRTLANSRDLESNVERRFIEMNEAHDRIRAKFLVQHQPEKSESVDIKDPARRSLKALTKGAAAYVSHWGR